MKKVPLFILSVLPFTIMAQTTPTLVADINTGMSGSNVRSVTALGSEVYFQAQAGGSSEYNLYRYTPTTGAVKVTGPGSLYPAIDETSGIEKRFGVINDKLVFHAIVAPPDTGTGTYVITEGGMPVAGGITGGSLNAIRSDLSTSSDGTKLYCWGSVSGSSGLAYINVSHSMTLLSAFDPFEFSQAEEITECNSNVFFVSDIHGPHQLQVYKPSTSTITEVAFPVPMSLSDFYPHNLWSGDDNVLYFSAKTAAEGRELFSYSTTGVVTKLTALNTSSDGVQPGKNGKIIKFGSALYFSGSNGVAGYDLMKYDLTTSTPTLVKDINPLTGSSSPAYFCEYGGKLYFAADNGTDGVELWVTDGTEANTNMVADINTSGSSNPSSLCVVDGKLYFAADNGSSGVELFSYSGSGSGGGGTSEVITAVRMVNDVVVFPNPAKNLVTFNMNLTAPTGLSVVLSDITGKQIYKTDGKQYPSGTASITVPVENYASGVYLYRILSENGALLASGKLTRE